MGGETAKIDSDHLIYFGLRDYETAEINLINELGISYYTVPFVRENGIEKTVHESLIQLNSCDLIYISFDVDSMDCDAISYGTGTPVPVGFYAEEIIKIFELFFASDKIKCVEFAEINPLLDNKGNRMAEAAFQVLAHVSKLIEHQ